MRHSGFISACAVHIFHVHRWRPDTHTPAAIAVHHRFVSYIDVFKDETGLLFQVPGYSGRSASVYWEIGCRFYSEEATPESHTISEAVLLKARCLLHRPIDHSRVTAAMCLV